MAGGAIRMVQMVGARIRAGSERTSVRDASREVRATPQKIHSLEAAVRMAGGRYQNGSDGRSAVPSGV